MYRISAYRIERTGNLCSLQIWPFDIRNDLKSWLRRSKLIRCRDVYVKLKSKHWGERYEFVHLPTARIAGARRLGNGAIGVIERDVQEKMIYENKTWDNVVDLQLYIPQKKVHHQADIAEIHELQLSDRPADILKKWNAISVCMHDACKMWIDYVSSTRQIKRLFALLLEDKLSESLDAYSGVDALWSRLNSLPKKRCLLIATGDPFYYTYREEPVATLKYEKTQHVFGRRSWQRVAIFDGRPLPLPFHPAGDG